MCPMKMNFCKDNDCPASQELLEYQNGEISRSRLAEVAVHLASCEFCSAEVDFYSTFPQAIDDESTEPAKIPAPLYELAEALLKNRQGDPSSLNSLLRDNGLVVDKA